MVWLRNDSATSHRPDAAALTIMVKNMIDDINVFLQLHIESCV